MPPVSMDGAVAEQDPTDAMGPEPSENPLLGCAFVGDISGLQKLFEDPEDPAHEKVNHLLSEQDVAGRTPIYSACMLGRSEVVRELAKYGINLNQQTTRGYLPIHCATAWGQLETVKALVELGADIQAINFRGESARDIAVRYAKTDCIEFLDWAEAKQALLLYMANIQQTITDPEKVHGRLNKEDKNTSLNACKAKTEWLENAKNPTIQDLLDQKQQLELTMAPIFNKLNAPRPETGKSSKH